MDIRNYFQKVRQMREQLTGAFVVVVSEETPDGGKPGIKTEVDKAIAAQLIVEGRARVATDEEVKEFSRERQEAQLTADAQQQSGVRVAVLSEAEMRSLKSALKPQRG